VSFRPSVQSVPPSSRPSVLSPISGGQGVTIKRVLGSGEHRAQGAGLCAEYSEKCAGHKVQRVLINDYILFILSGHRSLGTK
jgi:hypothetical protein